MTRPLSHHCLTPAENQFTCQHCGRLLIADQCGTRHRNHCPHCLWSLHVDIIPGDRRCVCRGKMAPICVWVRDDGEWALIHRCTRCGMLRANRIAGDDNPALLLSLGARPMATPAFPLDAWADQKG